ncbi:testis expressed gene 11 [Cricetulus griseus]
MLNFTFSLGDFAGDDCEALLLLYEFEVKTKTSDPSLYNFLDSVWKMPDLESRTLETMASCPFFAVVHKIVASPIGMCTWLQSILAMDKPAHYPTIAQKALKKLLVIHKNKEPIDVLKYSECMHNLIDLMVSDGISSIAPYSLKEIWSHLKNALSLISQTVNLLNANLMEALNKGLELRSAEMAERLKALAGPPEDPGSVPSTQTAAHNRL